MLKLTLIEFFLRLIPEMMIFMWGIYVISRQEIKAKNYIFSSITLALTTFFVRELPIHYGVHTIVNNVLTVCILIVIGIPILKSIYSTIIMTLILWGSEIANLFILNILGINIKSELTNFTMKCILGFPSLIFMSLSIFLLKLFFKKERRFKNCI
ncbi:hypothetical protein [Clostridium sp. JNZ J1-5]